MSKISAAMLTIQKELNDVKAKSVNPHFNSTYASLEDVLKALRPLLRENQVLMHQQTRGQVLITTLWCGDEKEEFEFPLILDKQTSQGLGSAVTYSRRYSLEALFGISETDDDGNGAEPPKKFKPSAPVQKPVTSKRDPNFNPDGTVYKVPFGLAHINKTLDEMGQTKAVKYAELLISSAKNKGVQMEDQEREFVNRVAAKWPPAPKFDPNDKMPE